jgi:hypothetical protein
MGSNVAVFAIAEQERLKGCPAASVSWEREGERERERKKERKRERKREGKKYRKDITPMLIVLALMSLSVY